jgi:thiol-disulfide isomerase/thioredoxin
MKRDFRVVLLLLAALAGATAQAADPMPFVAGSMRQIRAAHAGQPFVLALWSLTCTHCGEELAQLGRLARKYPRFKVVLVSIDTPDESAAVTETLARHGLARAESWVFADSYTERLRFEVDRQWHGELPRTYLYTADHATRAISGRLDPQQLEPWIQRHFPGTGGSPR